MPRPRAIEGSFGFRGERQPLMAPILRDHAHGDVELNLLEGGSATCFLAGRFVELPRERVAVFCFERDHDRCHRQVIVDRIGAGQPVVRLD